MSSSAQHAGSTIDLAYQFANEGQQRHIFQENTYKKITPCDVCSQVLRGESIAHFHSPRGTKRLFIFYAHEQVESSTAS